MKTSFRRGVLGLLAVIVMLFSAATGVWVFFSYAPDWDTKHRMRYGTDHERRELHQHTDNILMLAATLMWFLPAIISAGLLAVGHEDGMVGGFLQIIPICAFMWPFVWLIMCLNIFMRVDEGYAGPPEL